MSAAIYTATIDADVTDVRHYAEIDPARVGRPGPPNSLEIGTVSTGEPGTNAEAEITGAAPSQTLNLTIPRGSNSSGSYLYLNSFYV
jgi:hypothetical protein